MTTVTEQLAKQSKDFEENVKAIAREREILEQYKVSLTFDGQSVHVKKLWRWILTGKSTRQQRQLERVETRRRTAQVPHPLGMIFGETLSSKPTLGNAEES